MIFIFALFLALISAFEYRRRWKLAQKLAFENYKKSVIKDIYEDLRKAFYND